MARLSKKEAKRVADGIRAKRNELIARYGQRYFEEFEQWRTLGAQPGSDGKKRGGIKALIDTRDGTIKQSKVKGLEGKNVKDLGEHFEQVNAKHKSVNDYLDRSVEVFRGKPQFAANMVKKVLGEHSDDESTQEAIREHIEKKHPYVHEALKAREGAGKKMKTEQPQPKETESIQQAGRSQEKTSRKTMDYSETEQIGNISPGQKGVIKKYKKTPGDFTNASVAAHFYAEKYNEPMAIFKGNSYGSLVYHIARLDEDPLKYTMMSGKHKMAIVHPDGRVMRAEVNVKSRKPERETKKKETRKKYKAPSFPFEKLKEWFTGPRLDSTLNGIVLNMINSLGMQTSRKIREAARSVGMNIKKGESDQDIIKRMKYKYLGLDEPKKA